MPNSLAILPQRVDLFLRDRIDDRQAAIGGRHIVIERGHGPLGPAHLAAGQPQPFERLGAGHFVDQLEIDVQDGLFPRLGMDDVVVPDFLEHRAGRKLDAVIVGNGRYTWFGRVNSGKDTLYHAEVHPPGGEKAA